MVRVLILLAIIALLWWAFRPRPRPPQQPQRPPGPQAAPPAREIVACAHCGVHVPREDALPGPGGTLYCCEAHRRAERVD